MTEAEAKELLLLHSFGHPSQDYEKMNRGFLGSLRPYRGHLSDENFHEVMAALRVLAPSLRQSSVDQEVVGSLWSLCFLSRLWAVHPKGMLQSNGLIKPEDVQKMEGWLKCIEYAVMILLSAQGNQSGAFKEAFHIYDTTYKKAPPPTPSHEA